METLATGRRLPLVDSYIKDSLNSLQNNMPLHLVCLQVVKKICSLGLHGLKLSAMLEACNKNRLPKNFFSKLCFMLLKYLIQLNCSKIFMYGRDGGLFNKIWVYKNRKLLLIKNCS